MKVKTQQNRSVVNQASVDAEKAFYNLAAIAHGLNTDGEYRVHEISTVAAAQLSVIRFLTEQLLQTDFSESAKLVE